MTFEWPPIVLSTDTYNIKFNLSFSVKGHLHLKNNNIFYSQNQLFLSFQTLLLCLKLYTKLECNKFRNCIMSNPCLVRNSRLLINMINKCYIFTIRWDFWNPVNMESSTSRSMLDLVTPRRLVAYRRFLMNLAANSSPVDRRLTLRTTANWPLNSQVSDVQRINSNDFSFLC